MATDNSPATSDTSVGSTPAIASFHINGVAGLLIGVFLVAIVAVQWQRLRLMNTLIESAAIQAAKDHLNTLATVRTVYTEEVVSVAIEHGIEITHDYKKDGHSIPLPATLTMLIGNRTGAAGSGARTRLYSPYPFKWREAEGGLRDEFQHEAWEKLNADPETPFSRIVNGENGRTLRYAISDRMRSSCVQCHNEHPDSPRRGWKVGDVRGILEVELPLREIEARARRNLLESSALMVLLAMAGGAIVLRVLFRLHRLTTERDLRVRELNATNAALDQTVEERTSLLRASEERLELAVRGSTDGVWDWNVLTSEVYYSPRMKELLGHTDDEMPNVFESFESRLHPDDHDSVLDEVNAHLQHRKPYDVEYRLRTKSGEYRWFRARGQAIWNDAGQAQRMAGSITDITERKTAEQALASANAQLAGVLDASTQVSVIATDVNGLITVFNTGAQNLLGYSAEEMIGKQNPGILHVAEEMVARGQELTGELGYPVEGFEVFVAYAKRGRFYRREWTYVRKDGSQFMVSLVITAVKNAEGDITGYVGLAEDITLRKQTEEQLLRAKESAESASRAKSSFLANMSHEIRTPMNGIIGMAQLLAQTELRSHQRDYLTTVEESAHILMRLLNDILDFSKIEAGKLELECVDFRISECVGRASQMLVLRAAEKGLEIVCRVAPEIPDHLRGDSGRVQQVLVNLLGNAVKFTASGEIFVNVNAESIGDESIGADQVRLHLSVSDTGIGIPSDKQDQIFRPFEQAEASTTRRFGGTGLGLAISRQLVEMMHGRMWVESEPGRGSTFHFTAEFGIAADQHRHEPAELDSLHDLPVLVVDDNFTNRRILSEMLQYWHMQPTLADSAEAARHALQTARESQRPIRLILLDHHMPGEDGLHFAESLRGLQNPGQCPIIMISSGSFPVDADLGEKYGIGRFMTKPVIASELLNEVLRQFGRYTTVKPEQSPRGSPSAPVPPRRVLLVDDNVINRRVALGLLRGRGHQVVMVENGQEALNALAEQEFDVILMDMQMPVMDGYEATAEIRKREHQSGGHIPIVAMTAEALKGDRERCLALGMDDYVSKPITPVEMYRAVERFPALCLPEEAGQRNSAEVSATPTECHTESRIPENPSDSAPCGERPAIDWNVAKVRLGSGSEILREFSELVKVQSPTLLADIHRAIETRNFKLLRRSAHTMKGSVTYFGAEPLAQAALALENLGRAESFDGIADLRVTLEQELTRFLAALEVGPLEPTS